MVGADRRAARCRSADGSSAQVGADRRAARICGPEFTDKFEMWRMVGGDNVILGGAPAVVVVTDGEGTLNGLSVERGDRLVVSGESALAAGGALSAIVCL